MSTRIQAVLLVLLSLPLPLAAAGAASAVTLTLTNPIDLPRAQEPIVVPIAELRKHAPKMALKHPVVTVSTPAGSDHAGTTEVRELPSQIDDLDGDGSPDELVFQLDLQPHQTRTVSIADGDAAHAANAEPGTNALEAAHLEGVGWESRVIGWRLRTNGRAVIDVLGKRQPGLYLEKWAEETADLHADSPMGRAIFDVGNTLGVGSAAARTKDGIAVVEKPKATAVHVRARGPVRAVVEVDYKGWAVGSDTVDVRDVFVQWAGDHGFEQRVSATADLTWLTGMGVRQKMAVRPIDTGRHAAIWTWGYQVVAPGKDAKENLPDQAMGLGVVGVRAKDTYPTAEGGSAVFPLPPGRDASWWVLAAWDQETGDAAITMPAAFDTLMRDRVARLDAPVTIAWSSEPAAEKSRK